MASNKDFIFDFYNCLLDSSYLCVLDPLYKWIDGSLWQDKDFVFEILSKDDSATEYVTEELLEDADFLKKIKEELNVDL